jgi:hypothetical protein
MEITLHIPEELAARVIPEGQDPAPAALEALAVEGYRTQRLSESQVRQMLGFETRMEVHAFLKEHDTYLHYTIEDLKVDEETSRYLRLVRAQAANQQPR